MARQDGVVRGELLAEGTLCEGYHPRMETLHVRNAERLDEIVTHFGWPTRQLVGIEAADAAWLILQHAISLPHLQRRGLELLELEAKKGTVPAEQVAMLEDRVRAFEGKPQLYGTQYDWDAHGQLSPLPIDDIDRVNERRKTLGLLPLDENTELMRQRVSEAGEGPPPDLEARNRGMERWKRKVGWRS